MVQPNSLNSVQEGRQSCRSLSREVGNARLTGSPRSANSARSSRSRPLAVPLQLWGASLRSRQLKILNVDRHNACVKITGKGGKQRLCPLWSVTIAALAPLIGERAPAENFFLNRSGYPITRFGIHTLVERHVRTARIKYPSLALKRISPHSIRHSCATHLLRAGVDINTIRGWLGHVSVDTTNIYAEIDLEMKAKALAKCALTR